MKIILILAITFLLAFSETKHDLLISGFSKHLSKSPIGVSFNEKNYGVGYRYSVESKKYRTYVSVMVLNDSYSHIMSIGALGAQLFLYKNDKFNVALGVEGGFACRKLLYISTTNNVVSSYEFDYVFVPVLAPILSAQYKQVGININYVPEINLSYLHVNEVIYVYFSLEL